MSNYKTIIAVVPVDLAGGVLEALHRNPDVLSSFSEDGLQVAVNAGFEPQDYLDDEELAEEDFRPQPLSGQQLQANAERAEVIFTADDHTRVIARVQPQYWHNDYAVDAGPMRYFDVTEQIEQMGRQQAEQIQDNDDSSDQLWSAAVFNGVVADHGGPFYVLVADSIEEYFAHQDQRSGH